MTFDEFKAKWIESLNKADATQKPGYSDKDSQMALLMNKGTIMCVLNVLEEYHKNVASQ